MVVTYTKEDYAKAYTELLEVLKHISYSSLNKIPKEDLEMYNQNKDKNYKYEYNSKLEFEQQKMSRLTRILIANIYIQYWASEEERTKIKQMDRNELEQIEIEKRNMYNPDTLFSNRKKQNKIETESLVIIKKKNIFERIVEKIKQILNLT